MARSKCARFLLALQTSAKMGLVQSYWRKINKQGSFESVNVEKKNSVAIRSYHKNQLALTDNQKWIHAKHIHKKKE